MSETSPPPPDSDSLIGLMNQLAEVTNPEPVSMLPQTGGWIALALIVLAVLLWQGRRFWHRYQANAYRRAGLRALTKAADDPVAISTVLKRVALVAYGRRRVARLSGAAWLDFLETTGRGVTFGQSGADLTAARYQRQPPPPDPALTAQARIWITTHHPPGVLAPASANERGDDD